MPQPRVVLLISSDAAELLAMRSLFAMCQRRDVVMHDMASPMSRLGRMPDHPDAHIMLGVSLVPYRPSVRSGLRFLQRFRRTTRSLVPALVYSFETRETLARQFSILSPGMPGVRFLRAPFTKAGFEAELEKLEPLTPDELQNLLRWHCGLQEEWQANEHALVDNALRDWPAQRDGARQIVAEWAATVREFAPDQEQALQELERALDGDADGVREAALALARGLNRPPDAPVAGDEPHRAPSERAPGGFSAVLAADDRGLDPGVRSRLEAMGYDVKEVGCLEAALNMLQLWKPAVVLADLNLVTERDGLVLMREALQRGRLVIAVSKAGALKGQLPCGVRDCCGKQSQDTDRMHRLIWQHASGHRAESETG